MSSFEYALLESPGQLRNVLEHPSFYSRLFAVAEFSSHVDANGVNLAIGAMAVYRYDHAAEEDLDLEEVDGISFSDPLMPLPAVSDGPIDVDVGPLLFDYYEPIADTYTQDGELPVAMLIRGGQPRPDATTQIVTGDLEFFGRFLAPTPAHTQAIMGVVGLGGEDQDAGLRLTLLRAHSSRYSPGQLSIDLVKRARTEAIVGSSKYASAIQVLMDDAGINHATVRYSANGEITYEPDLETLFA